MKTAFIIENHAVAIFSCKIDWEKFKIKNWLYFVSLV